MTKIFFFFTEEKMISNKKKKVIFSWSCFQALRREISQQAALQHKEYGRFFPCNQAYG